MRVGEWVYALKGIFVLSLFLNLGAAILLVVVFSDSAGEEAPGERPGAGRGESDSVVEGKLDEPSPSAALVASEDGAETESAEADAGTLASAESVRAGGSVDSEGEGAVPIGDAAASAAAHSDTSTSDAPGRNGRAEGGDADLSPQEDAGGGRDLVSAEDVESERSIRELLDAVAAGGAGTSETEAVATEDGQKEAAGATGSVETGAGSARFRALVEAMPVERLRLVEEFALADAAEDHATAVLAAFVHDPDVSVRGAAMGRLAARLRQGESQSVSEVTMQFLAAAAPWIEAEPSGKGLGQWVTRDKTKSSSPELPWDHVESLVRERASTLTMCSGPFGRADRKAGHDVVLAIDVTESMADALESVRGAAAWLLRAIRWALPRARTGILFYRDDVSQVLGFESSVDEQAALLAHQEAKWGGDVPEGVSEAVRASLELGRFAWREEAHKVIVVLGDAPPRFAEMRPTVSLVRLARREAGYRVHVLVPGSVDGVDGGHQGDADASAGAAEMTFFEDLARSGGGRVFRVAPAELPCAILRSLFPTECAELAILVCAEFADR